jgi:endonuclease/exonuclease/phosphatase family metal-dependent hydrolase
LNFCLKELSYLKSFPYIIRSDVNTTLIFSKIAIIDTKDIKFDPTNGSNGCTRIDFSLNDKKISIYNQHLESNRVSDRASNFANNKKINTKRIFELKSMLGSIRRFSKIRVKQTESIIKNVKNNENPIVICGDFNDPPLSYTYNMYAKYLKDAFKNCGCGFGTTYAGDIPGLKIDHVFYNNKIKMLSSEIKSVNFSDHYPTVSKFNIK